MFRSFSTLAIVLALGLCACVSAPESLPGPVAAAKSLGLKIEDVVAANGPASQQWDLPDGRRAFQWQETSVMARVGDSGVNGAVTGAASQTTCFYTLYTRPDDRGRFKVVGYEAPRPGCMKLAMNARQLQ